MRRAALEPWAVPRWPLLSDPYSYYWANSKADVDMTDEEYLALYSCQATEMPFYRNVNTYDGGGASTSVTCVCICVYVWS